MKKRNIIKIWLKKEKVNIVIFRKQKELAKIWLKKGENQYCEPQKTERILKRLERRPFRKQKERVQT